MISPSLVAPIFPAVQALAKVLQFALRRGIDVPEITVLGSGDVDFDELLLPLVRGRRGWIDERNPWKNRGEKWETHPEVSHDVDPRA